MNLEHLHSFVAVARAGGFREATRNSGRSQPTLSQHIRKLEDELGTALLIRQHSGCQLTHAGQLLLERAQSAIETLESAHLAISTRHLGLGASSNIGTYLLPGLLGRFREAYPDDQVDVCIDDNLAIATRLERRQLDIALMEWWDNRPGFVAHCWREAELVLIVSPQHAWSRVNSLPASALRGAGLIGGEQASGTGRLLKSALGDIANSLTVEMQLGSTEAVKHAVHANLGVSVVMRASVERELASGYLHAVGIQGCSLSKQLFAVHAEHWPHTSAVSRFARQLAGTVAPGPAPL